MTAYRTIAALGAFSLALAACDSATDTEESAFESVETPAEAALENVEAEPVEDEAVDIEEVQGPPAVSEATATQAADAAADVAAQAEAAAAAAEAATAAEAADAAAAASASLDDIEE